MSLAEIIIQKIREEGPLSFYDFMTMALYHPQQGYYTSCRNRIGKEGDYYTSPYATSLFAVMLARQIEQVWQLLKTKEFVVLEYGGGNGMLGYDILQAVQENEALCKSLQYHIVEKNPGDSPSPLVREKLHWHHSIDEVPKFTGCVLSNEAVDNFPVHLVEMRDALMEVFINYKNGFVEELRPAPGCLKQYFEELHVELPRGFRTEVNLDAINWIDQVSSRLEKGFVITVDYGFSSGEIYSPKRCEGTLVCYHKHQVSYCPLVNVGEQDITTHVNFSALRHWGAKSGLAFCGFTTQSNFLLSLGLCDYLRENEKKESNSLKDIRQKSWLLHTFLMEMGRRFKVLVQSKGLECRPLSGLQLSQPLP